jgi:hypothetical protein
MRLTSVCSPTHILKIKRGNQQQKQCVSVQQSQEPEYVKQFKENEVVAELVTH